jgi:hypothetical protein
VTHRPDQPPVCPTCRSDRHPWSLPAAEDTHLPDGRLITLHRISCQCPRCHCTATVVRVITSSLPTGRSTSPDNAPTEPIPRQPPP